MKTIVLNRKLTLQARQNVPDGAGGLGGNWVTLGTHWAHIRTRSGRFVAHNEVGASLTGLSVLVRAAPVGASDRPVPGQRFVEGVRVFRIRAVGDYEQDGNYLICHVEEEVAI